MKLHAAIHFAVFVWDSALWGRRVSRRQKASAGDADALRGPSKSVDVAGCSLVRGYCHHWTLRIVNCALSLVYLSG